MTRPAGLVFGISMVGSATWNMIVLGTVVRQARMRLSTGADSAPSPARPAKNLHWGGVRADTTLPGVVALPSFRTQDRDRGGPYVPHPQRPSRPFDRCSGGPHLLHDGFGPVGPEPGLGRDGPGDQDPG